MHMHDKRRVDTCSTERVYLKTLTCRYVLIHQSSLLGYRNFNLYTYIQEVYALKLIILRLRLVLDIWVYCI